MAELRFDGQVAVVTGAGGNPGLGRSYAKLLAERGAKVVVNDLGVGPDGRSAVQAKAEVVAQEIRDAGGEAIADTHSVAVEEGAEAVIQSTLDAYGRIDILINNAGVVDFKLFEDFESADMARVLETHIQGALYMCRAAWPHMKQAGYGRIVNTVSGAVLGARYTSIYGTAKSAILGLTRNLAIEGDALGIKVNAIWPFAATNAWTLMSAEQAQPDEQVIQAFSPDLVAPVVGFLAHEDNPGNGKCIVAEANSIYELWFARTTGAHVDALSPEAIKRSWETIVDRAQYSAYADPYDGCAGFTLTPKGY